eukprot:TRINITY_DN9685_c0_g1_i3.p1 TRINITY_DN9685_c0_g1~~TRINITY_DN9685_c0_g1_i3.p1  ORF type:complete len:753 (+),score=162.88 TRINITY_DN9685_c0_g1_i3:82-2340(+)
MSVTPSQLKGVKDALARLQPYEQLACLLSCVSEIPADHAQLLHSALSSRLEADAEELDTPTRLANDVEVLRGLRVTDVIENAQFLLRNLPLLRPDNVPASREYLRLIRNSATADMKNYDSTTIARHYKTCMDMLSLLMAHPVFDSKTRDSAETMRHRLLSSMPPAASSSSPWESVDAAAVSNDEGSSPRADAAGTSNNSLSPRETVPAGSKLGDWLSPRGSSNLESSRPGSSNLVSQRNSSNSESQRDSAEMDARSDQAVRQQPRPSRPALTPKRAAPSAPMAAGSMMSPFMSDTPSEASGPRDLLNDDATRAAWNSADVMAPAQPNVDRADQPLSPQNLTRLTAWLKHHRLHKYQDHLTTLTPRQILEIDDARLREFGIVARGARDKFLKVLNELRNVRATLDRCQDQIRSGTTEDRKTALATMASILRLPVIIDEQTFTEHFIQVLSVFHARMVRFSIETNFSYPAVDMLALRDVLNEAQRLDLFTTGQTAQFFEWSTDLDKAIHKDEEEKKMSHLQNSIMPTYHNHNHRPLSDSYASSNVQQQRRIGYDTRQQRTQSAHRPMYGEQNGGFGPRRQSRPVSNPTYGYDSGAAYGYQQQTGSSAMQGSYDQHYRQQQQHYQQQQQHRQRYSQPRAASMHGYPASHRYSGESTWPAPGANAGPTLPPGLHQPAGAGLRPLSQIPTFTPSDQMDQRAASMSALSADQFTLSGHDEAEEYGGLSRDASQASVFSHASSDANGNGFNYGPSNSSA